MPTTAEEAKAIVNDPESPISSVAEAQKVQERVAIGAKVVYEAVRLEGEEELERHAVALAWSALAAGLSMGFSLLAEAALTSYLPDAPWRPLVARAGYSLGFLIVILGRQQLFTENTLTVILPLCCTRISRWSRKFCASGPSSCPPISQAHFSWLC